MYDRRIPRVRNDRLRLAALPPFPRLRRAVPRILQATNRLEELHIYNMQFGADGGRIRDGTEVWWLASREPPGPGLRASQS